MGCLRGVSAPLYKNLPLPLTKGKGIRGMELPNKSLKGVRSINNLISAYHTQEHATGDSRPNSPSHIGTHGMHQQEVSGVSLLPHFLHYSG